MIQEIIFLDHKKVHYKPEKTGNAFSSNYIVYRSNRDKDKALSIKDYLDEIKPYLNDVINDHKTHLLMAINFFFFKGFWRNSYYV